MAKNYENIVVTTLPERELEIIGTITAEKMSVMREKALKKLKESVELPGFRKGNVPDGLVAQKIGEGTLLEEAAEIALNEEYPNILDEHKIDAIGRPEIQITKIGVGSAMEFKIKTSIMPEVKLTDYKILAKKEKTEKSSDFSVTDKEVDDVILNIRQSIAHQKVHEEAGGGVEHNHREIVDSDLPEVNDEFAKMMGGFKDLSEMKSKIKESSSLDNSSILFEDISNIFTISK